MLSNSVKNTFLAVAILAGFVVVACSDDSSSGGAAAGAAGKGGGSSGDVCVQACDKFESLCKLGTCQVSGACSDKGEQWSECVMSHTCDTINNDCTAILLGGTGGSSGAGGTSGVGGAPAEGGTAGAPGVGGSAGGSSGQACTTLAGKCAGCNQPALTASCSATAATGNETACQAMLDDASFKAACP